MVTRAVALGAFGDEATQNPLAMFATLAGLGLTRYTPRFFNFGGINPINVMDAPADKLDEVIKLQGEFNLVAGSIGSRVGKSKLVDVNDKNSAKFLTLEQVLAGNQIGIDLCHRFHTNRLRAFSFYGPHGDDPRKHLPQAVDYIGRCVERCAEAKVVYGMEVETNLIGRNAELLLEIIRQVNNPWLKLVFDGGNLSSQGYSPAECYAQFVMMRPYLGWVHIKDYNGPMPKVVGDVHEASLKHFCTADVGLSGHREVFEDLAQNHGSILANLALVGVTDLLIDLEPHLKGGGQFGGKSGADGLGVDGRVTTEMLLKAGLQPHIDTFADIKERRGF